MHVTRAMAPAAEPMTTRGAVLPTQPSPTRGVWLDWLDTILARRAERRQLLALDARDLRDIGLTQADAWALARQPLWRR